MKLFVYHDAAGKHYPELDTREVSVAILCQYLGVSRWYVQEHAKRGDYGNNKTTGCWFEKARNGGKGGEWRFRPAVLWRTKSWGRFAQVGFNPLALETQVRVFCCDPAKTAERLRDQPQGAPELAAAFTAMSASLLEALTLCRLSHPNRGQQEAIPFELEFKNQ